MTRLIDADALIENLEFDIELNQRALDNGDIDHSTREIMQFDKDCKQNEVSLLREAPTVDAVPVIRCKDCKWWNGYYSCIRTASDDFSEDDYCSLAEREEE